MPSLKHSGEATDYPEEASEAGCCSAARSLVYGIPGAIFFVTKEQNKPLLALMELQDRVQALEGFRNDIFAIQDTHEMMQISSEQQPQVFLTASKEHAKAAPVHRIDSRAHLGGTESNSWTLNSKPRWHKYGPLMKAALERARAISAAVGGELSQGVIAKSVAGLSSDRDTASAIFDSDRQDSGSNSDSRDHGSCESTLAPKDELLELLDIIEKRGVQLKERVCEMEKSKNPDMMLPGGATSHSEVLEFHEKKLQARLKQMEEECAKLRLQVRHLRVTICCMEGERIACEEKLQASLCERKELEKKVHSLRMQFVRAGPSSLPPAKSEAVPWPATSLQGAEKLVGDVAKGIMTEEGKAEASSIVKESDLIELKMLLLIYTLENQALKEKADERDRHRSTKLSEWEATEASLLSDIQAID
ncbi:hypothetical protein HPB50_008925 [Hyalomma asiaticum]|uniref:Uncharacterized protein n=1 Tax=Hyalomma asiaticum TaxID=266040 RepID=A0ACB7TL24_HYAAI|nr:hypothetical protein HPB50_008925 [Hyalomma asiaticum]